MHCYFNGSFYSVVARGTSYFYSFFSRKWFWQELIFGMSTMAYDLGKPSPSQKRPSWRHNQSDEEVLPAVEEFFRDQDEGFFTIRIQGLQHRLRNCVDQKGDCFANISRVYP